MAKNANMLRCIILRSLLNIIIYFFVNSWIYYLFIYLQNNQNSHIYDLSKLYGAHGARSCRLYLFLLWNKTRNSSPIKRGIDSKFPLTDIFCVIFSRYDLSIINFPLMNFNERQNATTNVSSKKIIKEQEKCVVFKKLLLIFLIQLWYSLK